MTTGKRLFDLTLALLGLGLLWPLFVLITILIKCDDQGPVFFRQQRVGRHGKAFQIWKFRTMTRRGEKGDRQITVSGDPWITRVGAWLRKFKLDELPQLFNVVAGQMSFVGPRPEVPRYVAMYTPEQNRVLELPPGITDPASIKYRNENEILQRAADPERFYIENIMPDKIRTNLEYAKDATVWTDWRIVVQTFLRVAR